MPIDIECPHCHRSNPVSPSAIGHYVTCANCGSKYWVYVPPVEAIGSNALREIPSTAIRDDAQVAMRQESLQAKIHDDLVALRKTIAIATAVIVVAVGRFLSCSSRDSGNTALSALALHEIANFDSFAESRAPLPAVPAYSASSFDS